jgi:hypothetical protein
MEELGTPSVSSSLLVPPSASVTALRGWYLFVDFVDLVGP